MTMIRSIKRTVGIVAFITIISINSCDREPIPPPQPIIEQISIAELKSLHTGTTIAVDSNIYIQGVITLTPEKNNIPDFVGYIQDQTGGLTLTIDGNNTLAEGSELKILCKGIELTMYNGLMQFGNIDLGTQSELISLVATPVVPVSVTIQQLLDGEHLAELVSIEDVEFASKGTFSGSQTLTDCNKSIAVYTRGDATFSDDLRPEGNGTFIGVASIYNDAQLIMRDPADLDMTGARCAPFFEGIFQEKFSSLADYDPVTDIAGWLNPFEAGTREWIARTYSGNVYAQASAFGSGLTDMISWLITPAIDLSAATSPLLTFDTKAGYDNGASLEVLISSDYDGSASPWNATWITLNPILAVGPNPGYSDWVSSGPIDLSGYNSNVYIAFVYTGADPAKTTTWQIDNITIDESIK